MTARLYRNQTLENQEINDFNLAEIDKQLRAVLDESTRADVERLYAAINAGKIHGTSPYIETHMRCGCVLAFLANRHETKEYPNRDEYRTALEQFNKLQEIAFNAAGAYAENFLDLSTFEDFCVEIEVGALPFRDGYDREAYYNMSERERVNERSGREELTFLRFVVENYMTERGWL